MPYTDEDRWRDIACELAGALWATHRRLFEEHGVDPNEHLPSVYARFVEMLREEVDVHAAG